MQCNLLYVLFVFLGPWFEGLFETLISLMEMAWHNVGTHGVWKFPKDDVRVWYIAMFRFYDVHVQFRWPNCVPNWVYTCCDQTFLMQNMPLGTPFKKVAHQMFNPVAQIYLIVFVMKRNHFKIERCRFGLQKSRACNEWPCLRNVWKASKCQTPNPQTKMCWRWVFDSFCISPLGPVNQNLIPLIAINPPFSLVRFAARIFQVCRGVAAGRLRRVRRLLLAEWLGRATGAAVGHGWEEDLFFLKNCFDHQSLM